MSTTIIRIYSQQSKMPLHIKQTIFLLLSTMSFTSAAPGGGPCNGDGSLEPHCDGSRLYFPHEFGEYDSKIMTNELTFNLQIVQSFGNVVLILSPACSNVLQFHKILAVELFYSILRHKLVTGLCM